MIGVFAAAVMAASFFLPWIEFFGETLGPAMIFDDASPPIGDLPWQTLVFLAGFAIAALAAVLGLFRRAAGFAMFVAGAIPFGLIAQGMVSAQDQIQELGLPIPSGRDPFEIYDLTKDFLAIGIPAYFISAALLVVIGLGRVLSGR